MARKSIDCRQYPSENNCSIAISADNDNELVEAAVQHAVSVHKHADNEEHQLRVGLGQVLRYRQLLAEEGRDVRALIAVEREPSDPTWVDLCGQEEIVLVWPGNLSVP